MIKAGDVVWIPRGVKHWHGATMNDSLTHVAIQESIEGKSKDAGSPYLKPMIGARARSATVRVLPR